MEKKKRRSVKMHKYIVKEAVIKINCHEVMAKDIDDAIGKINPGTSIGEQIVHRKVIAAVRLDDMIDIDKVCRLLT